MRTSTLRDARAAITAAGRRATSPLAYQRAVAAQLHRVVPFDLWCGLTTDPLTGSPTGGYHDEGLPAPRLPRLVEIENGPQQDFIAFRALAAGEGPVQTLAAATEGDPARSQRYRDVLEPSGVRHEMRAVFQDMGGAWGAISLMRGSDTRDFTRADVRLLQSLSRTLADGVRRSTVLSEHSNPSDNGPGLLLCTVGTTITVDHASSAAREWLAEIDDGVTNHLPYAVAALVHAAHQHASNGRTRRVRMRTRAGRWLTLHAERLGMMSVSVIVEPARPGDLVELLADAYRLSDRERQVAALATRGATNTEIATALHLSPYTVSDHFKSLFAKTGTNSRTALAARLSIG